MGLGSEELRKRMTPEQGRAVDVLFALLRQRKNFKTWEEYEAYHQTQHLINFASACMKAGQK